MRRAVLFAEYSVKRKSLLHFLATMLYLRPCAKIEAIRSGAYCSYCLGLRYTIWFFYFVGRRYIKHRGGIECRVDFLWNRYFLAKSDCSRIWFGSVAFIAPSSPRICFESALIQHKFWSVIRIYFIILIRTIADCWRHILSLMWE